MSDRDTAQQVAQDAANDVRDSLRSFLGRGMVADATTNLLAATVAASVALVVAILGAIFAIAADLIAIFLKSLEAAREGSFDAMNNLIAAALGDLLSIEVSPHDIPSGQGAGVQVERVRKLGGAFHDVLYQAFGATGGADLGPGETAARAFTGFNLSYAANSALTGLFGEMASVGFFKEFANIGEDVGEALGMGRLHRRAIGPLFDALIITPMKQELNAKFTRELLPVGNLCTLANAGLLPDEVFQQQMAAHGFSPLQIARLQQAHTKPIPLPLLETLQAAKVLTSGQAIANLQAQGYDADTAQALLQSLTIQRQDKIRSQVVQDAFSLAQQRFMTDAEFNAAMDTAGVAQDEQALWTQRLSLHLDHAHKRLSIQEILYLLERNQITSDYLHTWAVGSGYSEDDAFTLEVWADLKDAEFDAKAKAAADKKKAADAKAKAKSDAAAAKGSSSGTQTA